MATLEVAAGTYRGQPATVAVLTCACGLQVRVHMAPEADEMTLATRALKAWNGLTCTACQAHARGEHAPDADPPDDQMAAELWDHRRRVCRLCAAARKG